MNARAALLAACLSLTAPAALAAAPFAGVWRGDWSDASIHQSGTATLNVGSDGTLYSGTVTNSLGLSSPLTGSIADSGDADLSYTYGGRGGGITYRAKGRFTVNGNRLSGVLDFYLPNDVVFAHGSFTLHRAGDLATDGGTLATNAGASAALAIAGRR